MVAATISGDLVTGFVLGLLLGLLLGPLIRSWLRWQEWTSASREADLIDDVLDRMDVLGSLEDVPSPPSGRQNVS